jgi:LmbE family N-acetylglucosaminyl deacetylase
MLQFSMPTAEVHVPDGLPPRQALARTTHLAIGAHPDDLEIMALDGILAAFGQPDAWFSGVIVTDGAGSARDNIYAGFSDDQMRAVRRREQKKAACVGEYGAAVFLDHPSSAVKDASNPGPVDDLRRILEAARPRVVYTHNLADKHPTHVGTALRTVKALRKINGTFETPIYFYAPYPGTELSVRMPAMNWAFPRSCARAPSSGGSWFRPTTGRHRPRWPC